jgi:quercetin dioxygenase-like cupin family protein
LSEQVEAGDTDIARWTATSVSVEDGMRSVFGPLEVEFAPNAGPAGTVWLAPIGTGGFTLVRFPPGFTSETHVTKVPSWLIVLQGRIEVALSDGARRTFEPGSVIRFADSVGHGHQTRALDDAGATVAIAATNAP